MVIFGRALTIENIIRETGRMGDTVQSGMNCVVVIQDTEVIANTTYSLDILWVPAA